MSDNKNDGTENEDVKNGPEDNGHEDQGREDVNDKNDGTENNQDDDDEDEVDDKKVYTKADIEKAAKRRQAALDRARKAEKELQELRKKHATEEQRLQIEAEEKAQAQAARFKPALVKQHVAYEMSFLGLNKSQIEELVQFVNMENIDVDLDDNSVAGVEEEVLRIQEKFPSLFPKQGEDEDGEKKPQRRKRAPKADGGPKPAPEKPVSARDLIAKRLRGEK